MKRVVLLLFPLLCVAAVLVSWKLGVPTAAVSQTVPTNGVDFGASATSVPSLAWRVVLALALVIALLLGAAYVVRTTGWNRSAGPLGRVRVLDRCWLGPRKALYTVRIGDRLVVVGVTDASIQPVLELSTEEGAALYPQGEPPPTAPSFNDMLKQVARKVGGS